MDRRAAHSILERLHAAQNDMYAGGDMQPVRALLTDDVEWHVPGTNAIAAAYRGIDEVLSYFRRRRELAADTLRLHPGELLLGEGEHIASLTDGSANVGGEEHRWSTIGLYRIREGRIAGCWLLPLDQAAFDRAWSASPERSAPERAIAGEPVLILTGAPGAGKTTVAKALISRYERAVHLECDRFFHLIAAGYVEPWRPESHAQNETVMSIVAGAAVSFADAEYFTVIDGIVSPRWFLGPLRDALAAGGHAVAYGILQAPLAICAARATRRSTDRVSNDAVIAQLYREFAELGELESHVIDNATTGPEQTAEVVAAELRGRLALERR